MIPDDIRKEVIHRLRNTEEQHGVRILMAIESGSRAWGFSSPDSDYDVRFIYARAKDWYIAVDFEEKRDVIEYPIVDEIDLNGWDVRKALQLFWKSNPTFVEWIQSPITYMSTGFFREAALALLSQLYSVEKGIYHYRSMAKTNYRGYLRSDLVPLKKYFYVLRPLLSIKWLETGQCPAPIEFHRILELIDDEMLLQAINELLEKKRVNKEMELSPAIPIINDFIESELNRLESFQPVKSERIADMEQLNELFHKVLNENTDFSQAENTK